jgi:hypothetical protein
MITYKEIAGAARSRWRRTKLELMVLSPDRRMGALIMILINFRHCTSVERKILLTLLLSDTLMQLLYVLTLCSFVQINVVINTYLTLDSLQSQRNHGLILFCNLKHINFMCANLNCFFKKKTAGLILELLEVICTIQNHRKSRADANHAKGVSLSPASS